MLVYCEDGLDGLDSSNWFGTIAKGFSSIADVRVTYLLNSKIQRGCLPIEMGQGTDISVVDPFERLGISDLGDALDHNQLGTILAILDAEHRFDAIAVQGSCIASRFPKIEMCRGRLWLCLNKLPAPLGDDHRMRLVELMTSSKEIICRSEDLRSRIEQIYPACSTRTHYWPSVDTACGRRERGVDGRSSARSVD